MLEQFMQNDYRVEDYPRFNDALLYLDATVNEQNIEYRGFEPAIGYKYQGNFFGLLKELEVPSNLFLYCLYVNGYTHPNQYQGNSFSVKVPSKPNIPSQ